MRPSIYNS